ncbi:Protein FAM64A [Sciurus carolinensis]|uniref:Protein FAM64A n=1 Tax=Sciurus carolinensis TaxID=30640 RepID=A0AA41MS48_SCICA|nr:Protein FAM64A [Sciurus carolinensis]
MASQWQNMGTSVRRRSLLEEEQMEEEVIRSAAGQSETSTGPLGSLCRSFQRRLPLRAVSLNLRSGPSWKRLETPDPEKQGVQAAARSAKTALGAMSQPPGKAILRVEAQVPRGNSRAHLSTKSRAYELDVMGFDAISQSEDLCESDSDLEPVGAGIQHLQKLSQKLNKAIVAEEGGDLTVSLIRH